MSTQHGQINKQHYFFLIYEKEVFSFKFQKNFKMHEAKRIHLKGETGKSTILAEGFNT